MQLKKWLVAVPLAMTLLTGCSVLERLVYRIDINQGNYVEQSAVDKLKFGMTKAQVRFVLGSPMLIENGYPNTWYYIYTLVFVNITKVSKLFLALQSFSFLILERASSEYSFCNSSI